jgi:hypothetical protein
MRGVALILAVCAASAVAASAQGQTVRSPRLAVVDTSPLVVAGAGFAARERVTVTALTSLGSRIQRTYASATGAFRVRFGLFSQPCGKPFAVRARGATGDVALARLPAPPCVPPPIR